MKTRTIGEIPTRQDIHCPNPECGRTITFWMTGKGEITRVDNARSPGGEPIEGRLEDIGPWECIFCGTIFRVEKDTQ